MLDPAKDKKKTRLDEKGSRVPASVLVQQAFTFWLFVFGEKKGPSHCIN